MILLISLLLIKHFVFDFWYQPPWMWQNKGTFGHWGGLAHSGIHAYATICILYFFGASTLVMLTAYTFEFTVHYLTDWVKMNINRKNGWACNTHNEFWQLTGFDQLIHQLTYIGVVLIFMKGI